MEYSKIAITDNYLFLYLFYIITCICKNKKVCYYLEDTSDEDWIHPSSRNGDWCKKNSKSTWMILKLSQENIVTGGRGAAAREIISSPEAAASEIISKNMVQYFLPKCQILGSKNDQLKTKKNVFFEKYWLNPVYPAKKLFPPISLYLLWFIRIGFIRLQFIWIIKYIRIIGHLDSLELKLTSV